MDYVTYSVIVAAQGVSTHVTFFAGPQVEHDARMFLGNMGMTEPATNSPNISGRVAKCDHLKFVFSRNCDTEACCQLLSDMQANI